MNDSQSVENRLDEWIGVDSLLILCDGQWQRGSILYLPEEIIEERGRPGDIVGYSFVTQPCESCGEVSGYQISTGAISDVSESQIDYWMYLDGNIWQAKIINRFPSWYSQRMDWA